MSVQGRKAANHHNAPPRKATRSLWHLWGEHLKVSHFSMLLNSLVAFAHSRRDEFFSYNAADEVARSASHYEWLLEGVDEVFRDWQQEVAFCHMVDVTLTYLKEILSQVYYSNPGQLPSSEDTFELGFLLKYSQARMSDLLLGLASEYVERRVSIANVGASNSGFKNYAGGQLWQR